METKQLEQIAAARYALIAPVVSRQSPLALGELNRWLQETARHTYSLPGSDLQTVSVRTLERYIAAYRRGGWEALKPQSRNTASRVRLPAFVLEKAIELRKERPERSVEQLVFLIEENGWVPKGSVAVSTLARHLRKAGFSRNQVIHAETETFRRFEAPAPMVIWQSDFKHFVHLPDPTKPGKKRKVILCAILDDHSRYIVHAQFYWDEQLPRLEDCLKKAILRHGVPETFYCDNGSVFASHHLARICGKLGIRLTHSRPYRPMGRGKVERTFQFLDSSFRPEVMAAMEKEQLSTLEELNGALAAWLDGYYHVRTHGSTKQPPRDRFAVGGPTERKRASLLELNEIFLWEEQRTVDKTGCVSLMGNTYEVEGVRAGQKVKLRYDPFDLTVMQAWWEERRLSNPKPVELTRKRDKRVKAEEPLSACLQEEPDGQLSFFEAAQQRREAGWREEEVEFTRRERDRS